MGPRFCCCHIWLYTCRLHYRMALNICIILATACSLVMHTFYHHKIVIPTTRRDITVYCDLIVLSSTLWLKDTLGLSWISRCPDFPIQLHAMDTLESQLSIQIVQVSLFLSVLINRFLCKLLKTYPASKLKWREVCRHSSRALVACTSIPYQFSSDCLVLVSGQGQLT